MIHQPSHDPVCLFILKFSYIICFLSKSQNIIFVFGDITSKTSENHLYTYAVDNFCNTNKTPILGIYLHFFFAGCHEAHPSI